jgi:thiamine phosphate synthase YjbQ (UPF0047 family)
LKSGTGALTDVSFWIPVAAGRMVLGTWQGIYLFEHCARLHTRRVVLHLLGRKGQVSSYPNA